MDADKFLKYIESHDYRDWFSNELIRMLHRVLVTAKEEGLTLDDLIQVLNTEID